MFCESPNCSGHVLVHSEGESCTLCGRVQQGSPSFYPQPRMERAVPHPLRRELENLVDRHLLSENCALAADKLFTLVRQKQINYARNELFALCISQAVFALCNRSISINQLSAALDFRLHEAFFRRKYSKLCKILPSLFSCIPFGTPSFGLSLLSLPPKKEHLLRQKCRTIMLQSKFNFSWSAAIYCIVKQDSLCDDSEILNFISSYPLKHDIDKCMVFLKEDKVILEGDFFSPTSPLLKYGGEKSLCNT